MGITNLFQLLRLKCSNSERREMKSVCSNGRRKVCGNDLIHLLSQSYFKWVGLEEKNRAEGLGEENSGQKGGVNSRVPETNES
ncbi:hypothetical protein I79_004657 [Cricetulus griseus]|uniref:Uncharacterized protein n=1 Tax=Cricetulus griseus TaxID=10029 RepID=G3H348_CRIGR|nr:hypothetical protein I79_004657 [Cricetulus griseus]